MVPVTCGLPHRPVPEHLQIAQGRPNVIHYRRGRVDADSTAAQAPRVGALERGCLTVPGIVIAASLRIGPAQRLDPRGRGRDTRRGYANSGRFGHWVLPAG